MVKTAREEFKQALTDPDVSFAIEVALDAGLVLSKRPNELIFETKSSDTDVVTHMDQLAEELIVAAISSGRPDDGLLGEEGAAKPSGGSRASQDSPSEEAGWLRRAGCAFRMARARRTSFSGGRLRRE